jgi:Xaa-Pro aminopeptidase
VIERMRKLREKMRAHGIDVFISFRSCRYFSGSDAGKAVLIPLKGDPILVCNRLEFERARRESWIEDVRAFSGWRSPLMPGERAFFRQPWELLADCLGELGARAVGYDSAPPEIVHALRRSFRAGYRRLPKLVDELRMVKSADELRTMRRAAALAVTGMRRISEILSPGISELELAAEAEHAMRRAGSEGTSFPTIVASGENSWLPHARATERRIARIDVVVVDLGCYFRGYASDMTRTFVVGSSRRLERLVSTVREAQKASLGLVRDGARARDVDAAARKRVGKKLLPFYLHGTGHGIGMDVHEPPSLSPSSREILRRGMVITVEPGLYVKGLGGARWEDMVVVEEDGFIPLTVFGEAGG